MQSSYSGFHPTVRGPTIMDIEFLTQLAHQLRIGKTPACRRAINRILEEMKQRCEKGEYDTPVDAESAFRESVDLPSGVTGISLSPGHCSLSRKQKISGHAAARANSDRPRCRASRLLSCKETPLLRVARRGGQVEGRAKTYGPPLRTANG
jgi:hypothetical protein